VSRGRVCGVRKRTHELLKTRPPQGIGTWGHPRGVLSHHVNPHHGAEERPHAGAHARGAGCRAGGARRHHPARASRIRLARGELAAPPPLLLPCPDRLASRTAPPRGWAGKKHLADREDRPKPHKRENVGIQAARLVFLRQRGCVRACFLVDSPSPAISHPVFWPSSPPSQSETTTMARCVSHAAQHGVATARALPLPPLEGVGPMHAHAHVPSPDLAGPPHEAAPRTNGAQPDCELQLVQGDGHLREHMTRGPAAPAPPRPHAQSCSLPSPPQRPRLIDHMEMTRFHTDDYINFLRSISPDNMHEHLRQLQRCEWGRPPSPVCAPALTPGDPDPLPAQSTSARTAPYLTACTSSARSPPRAPSAARRR